MASTLPPTPSVVTTVPVVSFPGESESAAKNDPSGPQALMRKTRSMEVQGQVDSKFDSNVSAHEGFRSTFSSVSTEFVRIFVIGAFLFYVLRYVILTAKLKKRSTLPYLILGVLSIVLLLLKNPSVQTWMTV